MGDYQIKITAGLNQTASATQIKRDLAQLNKTKNRVQLVGQLDRDKTQKNVNSTLGYLATTGEVTQKSMSSIGESFKTIFTRMNDIKANKLELIDEDGTTETLSDVELTLKNVGIDLRATVNEYKR